MTSEDWYVLGNRCAVVICCAVMFAWACGWLR